MSKEEYCKNIGSLRSKYQKGINDLYIWSSLVVESLDLALADDEFLSSRKFVVPSKKSEKTVKRTNVQISNIIKTARDKELFESVFSYLVTQGEAFLQEVLYLSLIHDETKLKTRVNGVEHTKKIDVNEIIDRRTRKALIDSIIEKEMISLFYAKPSAQFEYLEIVTEVNIDESIKKRWIEIKASRDVVVHNSGVINRLYLNKSGQLARGKEGDKIQIDKEYLEQSMTNTKSLVGKICAPIQRNLKNCV